MLPYRKSEWKKFRDELIELDGYKCRECSRGSEEVVLQVHHKKYITGRKPWEYPLSDCETLCRGCHSSKHGITKPKYGWTFIGQEDLGDLNGTCEYCGTTIRHTFLIQHEDWGAMEVGTFCCDKLTDSKIASNMIEPDTSFKSRRKRFLISKRWKMRDSNYTISQGLFNIEIMPHDNNFKICIQDYTGKKEYESLNAAKEKVFDVLESGEWIEYLNKHNLPLPTANKSKKKLTNRSSNNKVLNVNNV